MVQPPRQGLGLIIIADEVAAFAPEMQRLLSDSFEVQFPLWLTTHRELHGSARIRLVYDMLAEALAHPPRTIA
ncbi:hypothetical protein U5922_010150 [Aquicoccus sp. G2-2]|uniref:hypothetical protein n=1 Tax=Aquicoccus sp. G2-2 TaxID=3092120 RepID=UPI002ADFFF3D|nr:hypothetical protein [Aquicoccus sp. G2-2]MEA1113816.1 hypothetical protein [Aquicoccus sp. G2-2]